ncbi:NADP-dependent oxidoreductase [Subtercola lobariae]|uniref:Oxidoreductase n=1 Tax=Subtercola lobariae TaxID=1588641 RepID=A0A917EZ60_9MICO|nr:NADP-dependent oxidoreductase [Subtercola lobariae]GGF36083.1 oxidoreductase [Subtercola lobariae]
MKAITFDTYGGPEVLHEIELPVPTPAAGEVLVRVRFAAVNPYDLKLRSGAMQRNVHPTFPVTPGSEFAGVVEAVGAAGPDAPVAASSGGADARQHSSAAEPSQADPASGNTRLPLAVGDPVFGWVSSGSYAEFAIARATAVLQKPADLHWETAASIVVAGATAIRCLALLDVKPGETLLVHGGAGAVGAAAVQLAANDGVTVIATCSTRDAEAVRELGAHPVLYGDGVFERVRELAPSGVDAVLDTAGAGVLPASIELAGGPSRVLTIADPAAVELGVTFSGGGASEQTPDVLQRIADLALSGVLTTPPARHFALADAAAAHAALAAGAFRGKTLLDA